MFRARRRGESGIVDRSRTRRRRAGGISLESQEESPRAGAARVEAIALDPRREQHQRLRRRIAAAGDPRCQCRRGADDIEFDIPASTAPNLDVPGRRDSIRSRRPGRSRSTVLCRRSRVTVSIDGYSQARGGGVPFRYPNAVSSAVQTPRRHGQSDGGTFTLIDSIPVACRYDGSSSPATPTRPRSRAALKPIVGCRQRRGFGRPGSRYVLHHHVPGTRMRGPADSRPDRDQTT